MAEMRTPGIYVTEQKYSLNPLSIDNRCVTGFVGIAEQGPLHTPIVIKSFDEYLRVFGDFDTVGNLPFAVYNYFRCGGTECVVVRVADEKNAMKARLSVKCRNGAVDFTAKTEGVWGNLIRVSLWYNTEVIKEITGIDSQDGLWFETSDIDICEKEIVKISLFGHEFFRTVEKKDEQKIYFDMPIKSFQRLANKESNIKIEKAFVSININCKGKSENFLHLSMNPQSERYYVSYVNNRSRFCTVLAKDIKGIIKPFFATHASMGNDGIAELSAGSFIGFYKGLTDYSGLGCFESRDDISLIAIPDISWLLSQSGKDTEEKEKNVFAVQEAMINHAERFAGRFAVLDVPDTLDVLQIREWAKKIDTSCAAAYFPHIDVIDPLDSYGSKTVRLPPSGAICGCIAATDGSKGIFHAPANTILHGAVGLSCTISDAEYELLYAQGVNMLKYFPGRGIKVWGARTLSSDPNWRYINVRRTFSSICKSLKAGTQWAIFEVNDKNLRKRLIRKVSGFLIDLWMKGYLSGATAEESFYVRCDEELNPPENIDKGLLTLDVGFAITKPTEFFTISITAEKEGASVYIE